MKVFGGNWRTAAVVGLCALVNDGCINHDQVYLANPSPCHISCEYDHVKRLDPECNGYHTTCWRPWSALCPNCPPPEAGVAASCPGMEPFQLAPGEVPTVPSTSVMPEPIPSPTPAAPLLSNPTGQTSDFQPSLPPPPTNSPEQPRPNKVRSVGPAAATQPGGTIIPAVFELQESSAASSSQSQAPPRQASASNTTPDPVLVSAVLSWFSKGDVGAPDDHASLGR